MSIGNGRVSPSRSKSPSRVLSPTQSSLNKRSVSPVHNNLGKAPFIIKKASNEIKNTAASKTVTISNNENEVMSQNKDEANNSEGVAYFRKLRSHFIRV